MKPDFKFGALTTHSLQNTPLSTLLKRSNFVYRTVGQGSPTCGPQPDSGPWTAGHWAMGMAGECTHVCVHHPTHASTTAWALAAPFGMCMGASATTCDTGASSPFARACARGRQRHCQHCRGCVWPVCACAQALVPPSCVRPFAPACGRVGVHMHISLLLRFPLGCQPEKVGELCYRRHLIIIY